ncbi:MAG: hypothetical protein ACI4WM_02230, partial [Erysipelotrichaceae bacterium]
SRMIHYLIANEIIKRSKINNTERFICGSLLPDASFDHKKSHYSETDNESYHFMNLNKYYADYKNKLDDELYLGYYLHLVQDIIFRMDVTSVTKYDPLNPEELNRLYEDYHAINAWINEKYVLNRNIENINIDNESINTIAYFDYFSFIESMKSDFNDIRKQNYYYFNETMAKEYISKSIDVSLYLIDKLNDDINPFDSTIYRWRTT